MSAYIARRILLMVPTLARDPLRLLRGRAVRAGRTGRARHRAALRRRHRRPSRVSGRRRRFRRARQRQMPRPRMPSIRNTAARRGSIPEFIKSLEKQFGFDKPAPERFALMVWNFARFDFGKSYFRDVSVIAADQGEAAGLDVARHLDDAADLPDLDPARHPQGGEGRLAVRYLDLGGHHRRLCDPRIPVRDPADHPVRRRLVLQLVSRCAD